MYYSTLDTELNGSRLCLEAMTFGAGPHGVGDAYSRGESGKIMGQVLNDADTQCRQVTVAAKACGAVGQSQHTGAVLTWSAAS